MGKFEETVSGVGESSVLEHKTDISLKRIKIQEKLIRSAYRNSPMLFRIVPSPTPYGLLFSKIGGLHPQNSKRYYLRNGWSCGLQIWWEHSQGPSEQKHIKNFGEKERECIQGLSNFSGVPQLSQEWVKLRTSNSARTFIRYIQTNAH